MKFDVFAEEVIWALKGVEFAVLDREFSKEDFCELLLAELHDNKWDWGEEVDQFLDKLMNDPDFEAKMTEESEEW